VVLINRLAIGGAELMAKYATLTAELLCCLAIAIFASRGASQDHAPSVEQCKADQSVWGSAHVEIQYNEAETRHLQDGTPNRTDIALLTIPELETRMQVMYQCVDVVEMDPYFETGNFYHNVVADRYHGFLKRHGLMDQLLKEDAAGKR
jgi:hypothetical protein